jgi:hypothetical protein
VEPEATIIRLHDFLRREFKRGYEQVHVTDAERALRMRYDQFRDECYILMESGVCRFSGAVFWKFDAGAPTPGNIKQLVGIPMPRERRAGNYEPSAIDELGLAISRLGVEKVAEQNDIDLRKYAHLDNGRKRMTVGNILRARQKRGVMVVL